MGRVGGLGVPVPLLAHRRGSHLLLAFLLAVSQAAQHAANTAIIDVSAGYCIAHTKEDSRLYLHSSCAAMFCVEVV
eukprot:1839393-Rhodomonas_salina.1